jgi:hypothetical protein
MRVPLRHLAAAAWLALAPFAVAGCTHDPEPAVLPPEIDATQLTVGQPFPALVLPSLDGTPRAVADFRGEKLILHVFASW